MRRRHHRVQEALRSWGAALEKSIIGHRVDPPPIPRGADVAVLRLWTRERDGVCGRAAGRLTTLAKDAGLDAIAVRALRGKPEPERMVGIEACGRLGIAEVGDDLVRLVKSGRAPAWERAGVALVRIAPADALALMLPLIGTEVPASAPGLARVLDAAPEPVRGAIAGDLLADLARPAQTALTRALGIVPTPSALPSVRRILRLSDQADGDFVAGCVAALGAAGDASDAVRVRLLAGHSAWTVRMECAVALGALGGDEAVLRELQDDVEWLVRRAATDALRALGSEPPVALELPDDLAGDDVRPGGGEVDAVLGAGEDAPWAAWEA
jgi:HEAT repeat protein